MGWEVEGEQCASQLNDHRDRLEQPLKYCTSSNKNWWETKSSNASRQVLEHKPPPRLNPCLISTYLSQILDVCRFSPKSIKMYPRSFQFGFSCFLLLLPLWPTDDVAVTFYWQILGLLLKHLPIKRDTHFQNFQFFCNVRKQPCWWR